MDAQSIRTSANVPESSQGIDAAKKITFATTGLGNSGYQSTGAGTCSVWGICAAACPFPVFPGSVIFEA
jgi:hypothetical protein